jgi:hypothetical protein
MGIAYTIDSPVKVARFGISSVISIVEDRLIEMMRNYYYSSIQETYIPITTKTEDYRAKRITDYLNLVNRIIHTQIEKLRSAAFEKGSEITKYFEMLPDDNQLKQIYHRMYGLNESTEKENIQSYLRTQVVAGSIDVNIMTKTDRNKYSKNGELIDDGSDAVSALRGYAKSDLSNSSVIFSAGMNPRLYNYLEKCREFDADENGQFKKRIIIKVTDYRSALIQGKYLAKKGIWVSEFRVESGLNCGGHAFATDGYLLGPIMEEFRQRKTELTDTIFQLYTLALSTKGKPTPLTAPPITLSVQGGIGTAGEDAFLHKQYDACSTGWGTPFLLVPEATTVDNGTLELLKKANKQDVVLSSNSPLGVRFHYLKGTTSDKEKQQRIENGKPGSPCTEKHLEFNTEFTDQPICTASYKYQKLKIAQLRSLQLTKTDYEKQVNAVLEKECLCIGLSNAASIIYKQPFIKNLRAVTICPGPNIAYFSQQVSLQTMIDHIYGRTNIIEVGNRPNMFITELNLYVNYLNEQFSKESSLDAVTKKYYTAFCNNLLNGISYYHDLKEIEAANREVFESGLEKARSEVKKVMECLAFA